LSRSVRRPFALYKRPKVLVMDEATSALDVELEQAVNTAIGALDVTRIIIAHRPETIASARRLIGLRGGHVVQDAPQIPNAAPVMVCDRRHVCTTGQAQWRCRWRQVH
jgi:ABC-type transport system involved in cytochrome bd biosynthesis fused ATPase/permease subunit